MAVSADTLRLAIVEETTPGTTPSTPTWETIRTTGEGLTFEPVTTESAEITGDSRGVADDILAGATVQGAINFELAQGDAFDMMLAGVFANDWATDDLSDAADYKTFTIEKRFTVADTPTYTYHRFTNCVANTLSLAITPNEPITGSIGWIGESVTLASAEVASSTYNAPSVAPVMTAPLVSGLNICTYGGETPVAWMAGACFTQMNVEITNNARGIACIGHLGTDDKVLGKFNNSMNGTLLYTGDEMLAGLIARTEYALALQVEDSASYAYKFVWPRVKIKANPVNAGGTGQDVVNSFTLQALKDASAGYTCQVTRD